jgi:hypothetical protein
LAGTYLSNNEINYLNTLLYRVWDPLLGVFTGVLAFQLRQNNPQTAPPEGETLSELVKWKYTTWKEEKRKREVADERELWATLNVDGEKVSFAELEPDEWLIYL